MSHERSGEETPPGAREPSRDALDRRVAELNAKHDSLSEQVTHLVALMNALQRSDDSGQPCERFAAEADDEAEEPAPFEQQRDECERQRADDSERRPAAVSSRASLLNQQSELLRQRGSQIESLTAQLKVAQQICEIALAQYREAREERDALKQRLSQLEAKRSAAKPVVIG